MDGLEFRKHGRDMVDYIVDYLDNIDSRRVTPNTEPGYLQNLIPSEPPNEPEEWDTIMDDVEKKIMIGVMTTLINIFLLRLLAAAVSFISFFICAFTRFMLIFDCLLTTSSH